MKSSMLTLSQLTLILVAWINWAVSNIEIPCCCAHWFVYRLCSWNICIPWPFFIRGLFCALSIWKSQFGGIICWIIITFSLSWNWKSILRFVSSIQSLLCLKWLTLVLWSLSCLLLALNLVSRYCWSHVKIDNLLIDYIHPIVCQNLTFWNIELLNRLICFLMSHYLYFFCFNFLD